MTRIIFFGSRSFVVPVAQALQKNFNLQAIVTVPDKPSGRHLKLAPTPVKQAFLDQNIPIFSPERLDQDFADSIKSLEPDLFVVAAYGKIIPQVVLDLPKLGTINLHPSLLPKFRGPSPLQTAILEGEKETGMSYMLLDENMDHGPILYQKSLDIDSGDNYQTLGNKIFQQASQDITQIIKDYILGKLKSTAQNHAIATFCDKVTKEDGYFEINNLPTGKQALQEFLEKLDRMIRAYYPWPTAWTKWNGKIVKLLPEGKVQIEGKAPVSLKEFLNGYQNFPIKQLF
ncbi:methionyl-tRNA formyltransferase [Candidatus Daviesbacteria bacterium]|nr:methionyl-tRNA formyltransferase [Candidatus Daviesbacteria bacterium]